MLDSGCRFCGTTAWPTSVGFFVVEIGALCDGTAAKVRCGRQAYCLDQTVVTYRSLLRGKVGTEKSDDEA